MTGLESTYTWTFDSVSIVLRYFFLAGIAYVVFYVLGLKIFKSLKIQQKLPSLRTVYFEVLHSISTLFIYCGVSWLVFRWEKSGHTRIYHDLDQYGWVYFFLSILIMVFVHDTYFYWSHRLLHLRPFFRIHKTHHYSTNPTPWASFSFHPVEAIVSVGIIPIIVFTIPCHPFALYSFLTIMTLINVVGHLGFETFPSRFIKSKVGKWQNTSTNHNIHHQKGNYNFGLYFTFWDYLMKTRSTQQ